MKWLFCFILLLMVPQQGWAQGLTAAAVNSQPELTTEPAFPSPGELVSVTLNDYRSSASGAELHWFYKGAAIAEADNQRKVQVVAPEAGASAQIKVVIEHSGISETFQTTLKPLYFDLIIEPQTHVPNFYTARPLPSVGSQIKVTTLLNNGAPLNGDFVYLWRINDAVYGGGPLRGARSIVFPMPQGSNVILSVQVSSGGDILARRTMLLPSSKPELVFYELNSLYGLSTIALGKSFNLISNSAVLIAEPYNLNSALYNGPDLAEWKLNRQKVSNNSLNPYEITLERTGDPGATTLSFHVRSLSQLLQGTEASVLINI